MEDSYFNKRPKNNVVTLLSFMFKIAYVWMAAGSSVKAKRDLHDFWRLESTGKSNLKLVFFSIFTFFPHRESISYHKTSMWSLLGKYQFWVILGPKKLFATVYTRICRLLLFGSKASTKPTGPISFKLAQALYFRPAYIHNKLFRRI